MNVTGRIICNTENYITGLKTAQNALKRRYSGFKNARVTTIDKRHVRRFEQAGVDVDKIARETVAETGRYIRGNVYRLAYVAPEPYKRYGVIYQPRTLAERSYSFLIPSEETGKYTHICKVSFYNNAESGWFGEVAVLWEYGSAKTPAHPMIRPSMELGKEIFRNGIKYRLSKVLK